MDKILSARVDEVVVREIADLAHRLHTTKKHVIEQAVRQFAEAVESAESTDVLERTCGAWKRREGAGKTAAKARRAFRASMNRHQ